MTAVKPVDSDIRWRANAKTDSTSIIRLGFWSVAVMMCVFLLWATLFPLSSAVVTPGTVVSQGQNKLIQHSSGGRISEIFVKEGALLQQGDLVLELDKATSQAELTRLESRHASLDALRQRLDAERSGGLRTMGLVPTHLEPLKSSIEPNNGSSIVTGSIVLRGSSGSAFKVSDAKETQLIESKVASTRDALLESQLDAYHSGRKLLAREIEGLEKKVDTLRRQQEGLKARVSARRALLEISNREVAKLKPLVRQGYVARNRLHEKQRTVLELEAAITGFEMESIGIGNQVEEVQVEIRKARITKSDKASREYSRILGELAEISDQLIAARSAVKGSMVRAPVSGTLTQLSTTTVGGVIGAGDVVGEIVPLGAPLVVQARVVPGDIDFVQVDQTAEIAVTAFNRRIDDSLKGRVVYKSADVQKDEKTGDSYFTVRLEIDGVSGKGRSRLGDIQAGMQTEVYIHTGSRTFLTYLAKPMIDSFRRAFREQ